MARIKWGMFVTDGRGKVGGHVLTKTRSGATVRTKVTPSNPKTSFQGEVRAIFGSVSKRWTTLSEHQRLTWINASEDFKRTNVFGDQYKPSGKNLFTAINSNLLNIGSAMLDHAPEVLETPYISILTVSVSQDLGQISLDYQSSDVARSYFLVLEATAPLSAGKYNFSGQYRKIGVWDGGTTPDDEELYAFYVAKFGVPPLGKKISFRTKAVMLLSGLASPVTTIDAIVGA